MSKNAAVVALACQIVKLRDAARMWKQTAQTHREDASRIERRIERERFMSACLVDKLIADRDAAWKERDERAADHEAKMAEHRAAFGARTEADAKIIEGLRTKIEDLIRERNDLYQREGIEQKRRTDAEEERDGLLTESPPAPPEASHDTTAGKEAAASVIRNSQMTEIKVGDVVEVVSASGGQTWMADVGSTGKVRRFELIDSIECVRLQNLPGKRNALGGYVSLCDVRKVPQ